MNFIRNASVAILQLNLQSYIMVSCCADAFHAYLATRVHFTLIGHSEAPLDLITHFTVKQTGLCLKQSRVAD